MNVTIEINDEAFQTKIEKIIADIIASDDSVIQKIGDYVCSQLAGKITDNIYNHGYRNEMIDAKIEKVIENISDEQLKNVILKRLVQKIG